jgi:hypothetical protein
MNKKEVEEIEKEDDYTPYCKNCHACGEDGCCSALNCARAIMLKGKEIKDCHYSETYFQELRFRYYMFEEMYEIFEDYGNEKIKQELDKKYDEIYDKVYKNE